MSSSDEEILAGEGVVKRPRSVEKGGSQTATITQYRSVIELRFLNLPVVPTQKILMTRYYSGANNIIRASTVPQMFRLLHHYMTARRSTGDFAPVIPQFELTSQKYNRYLKTPVEIPVKLAKKLALSPDLIEFNEFMLKNPWQDLIDAIIASKWRRVYEILHHDIEYNIIIGQRIDLHGIRNILPGLFSLALETKNLMCADIIVRYAIIAGVDIFQYPCTDSDKKIEYLIHNITENQKKTIRGLVDFKLPPAP